MIFVTTLFALVLLTLLISVILTYLLINTRKKLLLNKVPSPKGLPIIGHGLYLTSSVEVFKKFKEWTRDLGKLIKLNVGPKIIYLTCDSGLLQHILSSNTLIKKADFYKFIQPWLSEGLIVSSGEKWKQRRKALTPTFHFKILEQFLHVFDKHARIFVKKLVKEENKNSVELSKILSMCTLDIICESAMGVNLNAQQDHEDNDYIKAVHFLSMLVTYRTYSIIGQNDLLYLLTANYRKERAALKIAHDFTDSIIKKRRNELLLLKTKFEHEQNDLGLKKKIAFLDLLLQTTIDGKPLSNEDIREEVDNFMFAGHDTTAATVSFVLYCLAKNPQAQQKVYEEITSIFDEKDKDKVCTYADLQNMKYTEMVIKETLRLYPVVPYIGREVTQDFDYNGNTFEKGNTIILYIYGAHYNPDNFEKPTEFKPERWDTEIDNNKAYFYIPFSAGPRNCIGQKFAMLEMKCLLSKIVKNFELFPSEPDEELILANESILRSINGINIKIKKRN